MDGGLTRRWSSQRMVAVNVRLAARVDTGEKEVGVRPDCSGARWPLAASASLIVTFSRVERKVRWHIRSEQLHQWLSLHGKSEVESGCLAFVPETVHEPPPLLLPAIMPAGTQLLSNLKECVLGCRRLRQGFT
ncbi:hypothetical protein KC356_g334 [Hortaea werneckii]|nr:hypothetical protein KC356_g334 [Hortaea werneckii]